MLRAKRVTPIRASVPDASATNPLREHMARFLAWTRAIGLAEQTAAIRGFALGRFIVWAHRKGITSPRQITREVLEDYQAGLSATRKANGEALAVSSQVARLNPLRAFCKWLARERVLPLNPATDLIMPRVPRMLPRRVLSVREVRRILRTPCSDSPSGIRDRAILELLYSTGMRRMELVALEIDDVDLEERTAIIRCGKGGRDRKVPIGRQAAHWVGRYLVEAREALSAGPSGALFLTDYGEPFRKNRLGDLVRKHLVDSGVRGGGACHLFRHACATHMLECGADVRYIQAMLGHADLATTQIYTHVSIARLREVHAGTTPGR